MKEYSKRSFMERALPPPIKDNLHILSQLSVKTGDDRIR